MNPKPSPQEKSPQTKTISRLSKYFFVRGSTILFACILGIFFSVVVINLGGFVDEIYKDRITHTIMVMAFNNAGGMSPEQFREYTNEYRETMYEAYGLNIPFWKRAARWAFEAATFQLGEVVDNYEGGWVSYQNPPMVKVTDLISSHLPETILLFTTGNLLTFVISITIALAAARSKGPWMEKFVTVLTPIAGIPGWVIGVILTLLISPGLVELENLPPAEAGWFSKILSNTSHLIIPFLTVFLGTFAYSIVNWRIFFLQGINEDYIEMAKAMGLKPSRINRKHLLRPLLPTLITSLSLTMVLVLQGAIPLEISVNWHGIGWLFLAAYSRSHRSVMLGITVVFAYLLGITMLLLDIVIAIIDPRMKISTFKPRIKKKQPKAIIGQPSLKFSRRKLTARNKIDHSSPLLAKTRISTLLKNRSKKIRIKFDQLHRFLKEYPALLSSSILIICLFVFSITIIIGIPPTKAINLWRNERLDSYKIPKNAQPIWVNLIRHDKLPQTIIMSKEHPLVEIFQEEISEEQWRTTLIFPFDYDVNHLPQDIKVRVNSQFQIKVPMIRFAWIKPDGSRLESDAAILDSSTTFYLPQLFSDAPDNQRLSSSETLLRELFSDPNQDNDGEILHGTYQLEIVVDSFEKDTNVEPEFILLGLAHGIAGTDGEGRELYIPLLWGLPLALLLGLLGGVITNTISMIFSTVGAWFGGWLDSTLQVITEVNLIIPIFPIALTIYFTSSKSILVILPIIILLSVFKEETKKYRSYIVQIREKLYVEAAQAYGATDIQIIFRYLIPSLLPHLISQIIISIPTFIFLEATLAFLGISGMYLPTWGKLVRPFFIIETMFGLWRLELIAPLILTCGAFSVLGFFLEKITFQQLQNR